jgi:hypothetical protein
VHGLGASRGEGGKVTNLGNLLSFAMRDFNPMIASDQAA